MGQESVVLPAVRVPRAYRGDSPHTLNWGWGVPRPILQLCRKLGEEGGC